MLNAERPILPTNDIDFIDEVTNIYREGGEGCDYKDSKKPEKLLALLIDMCTQKGDYILDMFGGSGTTFAASVKTRRRCVIVDNNENAINIILNRVNNMKIGADIDSIRYSFEYKFENNIRGKGERAL